MSDVDMNQFYAELSKEIFRRGGITQDLEQLFLDGSLKKYIIQKALTGKPYTKRFQKFKVAIRTGALKYLIKKGKYGLVSEDIYSILFLSVKTLKRQVICVVANMRGRSPQQIIEEFRINGFRPANLRELLSFGLQFPKEQFKYRIFALGSRYNHEIEAGWPFLGSPWRDKPILNIWRGDGSEWNKQFYNTVRFLGVKI